MATEHQMMRSNPSVPLPWTPLVLVGLALLGGGLALVGTREQRFGGLSVALDLITVAGILLTRALPTFRPIAAHVDDVENRNRGSFVVAGMVVWGMAALVVFAGPPETITPPADDSFTGIVVTVFAVPALVIVWVTSAYRLGDLGIAQALLATRCVEQVAEPAEWQVVRGKLRVGTPLSLQGVEAGLITLRKTRLSSRGHASAWLESTVAGTLAVELSGQTLEIWLDKLLWAGPAERQWSEDVALPGADVLVGGRIGQDRVVPDRWGRVFLFAARPGADARATLRALRARHRLGLALFGVASAGVVALSFLG